MRAKIMDEEKQQEIRELLSDYGKAKKHLFIRLGSREQLGPFAAELVQRDFLDLAVTCHIDISHILGMDASIQARTNLLPVLGVTEEKLFEDALENSMAAKPARVTTLSSTMRELLGIPGEDAPEGEEGELHVVTNEGIVYGAAAILYPGVLKRLAGKLGGNLFLIPSSVHEFLAIRDDCGVEKDELEALIRDVNRAEVAEQDRLSDHLYRYDMESGEVTPA